MPLQNQLHVDQLLSNLSIKYRPAGFIGMDLFPEVQVKKSSDLFRVYNRDFKLPETERNTKSVAKEYSFEVSSATYLLQRHSLKDYVSDRDAENYDIADLRAETTEFLTEKIMLRQEHSILSLFTTTNWSLNVSLAAANAFNQNTTVSNPIPVFDTGAATIIANTGLKPNVAAINREAFIAIKNHVSVLDRVKYTSAEISEEMVGALLGLPAGGLKVSDLSYDTAANGVAESLSAMLGDVAFLGYRAPAPGPLQVSAGYVFRNSLPLVKRWRVEERESDAIEVNSEYQARIVASLCGYLIKDII